MTESRSPRTEAGKRAVAVLTEFREWSADPNVKRVLRDAEAAILAIEAEAAAPRSGEGLSDEETVIREWLAGQLNPDTGGPLPPSRRLSQPLPRRQVVPVVATLIEALDEARSVLARFADRGCDAAAFYALDGQPWDTCLDPEYREEPPTGIADEDRCDPCRAHAAIV